MAVFSTKILLWRVGGRRKNDFSGTMAAGCGAELVTGRRGGSQGHDGGGGVDWYNLTQRVILLCF